MRFWSELRRRHVVRVAIVYGAVAYAIGEVSDIYLPRLGLPDSSVTLVLVLLVLGFPLAMVLAWAYDMTPEGVVRTPRTTATDQARSATPAPEQKVEVDADSDTETSTFPSTSIVVLPFDNLSDDPGSGYFTDGVMEDILSHISRIGQLHVISRTSAMTYRGTSKPARQIARELRVGSILEGSVRRAGERIRVVAQLIDASSDKHVWAETYDRDVEDIFQVQSDVAEKIAGALRATLEPEQVRRIRRRPTKDLRAYELCVRGRQLVSRLTATEYEQGADLLKRAIDLDPNFALAHAYLSYAHAISPYYSGSAGDAAFPAARAAADRALELDEGLSAAWSARALARYHYDWDWTGALEDFDNAERLDPNDPDVHYWRGYALALMRRFDEATEAHERSTGLDPHASLRTQHLGLSLFFAGREDQGLQVIGDAITRDPSFFELHFSHGLCLLHAGRNEEGVSELARAADLSGHPWHALFHALGLHIASRGEEAQKIIRKLRASAFPEGHPAHMGPSALAIAALAEADIEGAVTHIEEAAERRAPAVLYLRTIVPYPALQNHPRFQALNDRIWSEA